MGGGKKHKETKATTVDQPTAAQVGKVYNASDAYAKSAPIAVDQNTLDAIAGNKQYAAYGNQGLLALNGDPTAMAQFQTPGGQDILNQMDVNNAQAVLGAKNATNQSATRAGAFGGSRAALAQGTAVAGVNANTANQKAQFQYQQNNDAFSRASQAANLGMGANANSAQYGQYMQQLALQNDPNYKRLMAYKMGLQGTPYGTTTTDQTVTPWGSVVAGGVTGAVSGFFRGK